jgi:hypothetical protein
MAHHRPQDYSFFHPDLVSGHYPNEFPSSNDSSVDSSDVSSSSVAQSNESAPEQNNMYLRPRHAKPEKKLAVNTERLQLPTYLLAPSQEELRKHSEEEFAHGQASASAPPVRLIGTGHSLQVTPLQEGPSRQVVLETAKPYAAGKCAQCLGILRQVLFWISTALLLGSVAYIVMDMRLQISEIKKELAGVTDRFCW